MCVCVCVCVTGDKGARTFVEGDPVSRSAVRRSPVVRGALLGAEIGRRPGAVLWGKESILTLPGPGLTCNKSMYGRA